MPLSHCVQLPALPREYVPALHSGQDVCPEFDCLPSTHAEQLLKPAAEVMVPSVQSLQVVCPIWSWCWPGTQSEQLLAPSGMLEDLPSAQGLHSVSVVAPIELKCVPTGHGVHFGAPVVPAYWPARHAVQL
eukprot:COSAG05_NODE_9810_length_599_cov_1.188000_1_plen_130_part_01